MKHPFFLPGIVLSALMTVAVFTAAVAPALATTSTKIEHVRGRHSSDGREMHVGGSARRPSIVIGAGAAMALAAARDNRIASPDGRLERRAPVQRHGAVTGARVTRRP